MSDSLRPHGLQHARPPKLREMVFLSSCLLNRWYHPTMSSSATLFSFCLQSFPASGSFPVSWVFASGGQSTGASVSASVLSMSMQSWLSFKIDCFDLAVQETLKSLLQHHNLKTSILQCSAFFMDQHSHPYMTTGKNQSFDYMDFIGKVMSLFFNMLSRFVIAFFPISKCIPISWVQSPSAVILKFKKRNLSLLPLPQFLPFPFSCPQLVPITKYLLSTY